MLFWVDITKVTEKRSVQYGRVQNGLLPRLEEAVVMWLLKKASKGVQINGSLFHLHAKKLLNCAKKT